MNSRPFEQYQLSCIEERSSGAALIFYLSHFNIAWIFYNRDECRDFKSECIPLGCIFNLPSCQAGIAGKGWFLKPHSFRVRFF